MSNTKQNSIKLNLGDKTFWRVALSLAIPIALQNMLTASFSLIDTLMVGQLGELALASVGRAGQWSWLLNMATFGITSGAAVFVSQYWGENNKKGIHRTLGIALAACSLISIIFTVLALFIPDKIMYIFTQNADAISLGVTYLRYACFSYPAVALSAVLSTVLRSTENVKLPMIVASFSTVANAIFNYLLIFPAGLGVKGAAIATVISSWLGVILLLLFSLIKKNIIIAPPHVIFSITRESLVEFFKKATPVMLNETMWGLGTVTYNIIFSNLGDEAYAAITIVKTFEQITFCFFIGLCNACCVMLGKAIGAGEILRGVRDAKRFNVIMPITSLIVGALVIIFRSPLVSLFNIGEQVSAHTLELAEWILIIYGVWIAVRNTPYLLVVGVFRPGGDTMMGMKVELLVLWAFAVPLTAVAAFVLKLPFLAVYAIMYLLEDIPKAIIFIRHYISNKWIIPVTEAGRLALKEFNNR